MDAAVANAAAADLSAQAEYEAERSRLEKIIELEQRRVFEATGAEAKIAEHVKKATAEKAAAEAEYQKKREEYIAKNAMKESAVTMVNSGSMAMLMPGVTAEQAAKSRADAALAFDESEEGKKAADRVKKIADAIEGIKTDKTASAAADAARAKIEQARAALETLETRREARELAERNEMDAAAKKAIEEERADAERAAKAEAAARMAADREAAKERERLDREAHARRMAELREEIAARREAQSKESAVRNAAQSEFDRAFAMYRDPSRAAAEIGEEKARSEDLDRLHRDARRYSGKWRIDELASLMSRGDSEGARQRLEEWRKSGRFDPETEAMVRASAAEKTRDLAEERMQKIADGIQSLAEEQKAATASVAEVKSAADAIDRNTASLASKLDELLSVKG